MEKELHNVVLKILASNRLYVNSDLKSYTWLQLSFKCYLEINKQKWPYVDIDQMRFMWLVLRLKNIVPIRLTVNLNNALS